MAVLRPCWHRQALHALLPLAPVLFAAAPNDDDRHSLHLLLLLARRLCYAVRTSPTWLSVRLTACAWSRYGSRDLRCVYGHNAQGRGPAFLCVRPDRPVLCCATLCIAGWASARARGRRWNASQGYWGPSRKN